MLIGKYEEKCCHHSTGKIPSWSLVAHSKVRTQDGWLGSEQLQVDFNLPSSQLLNYFLIVPSRPLFWISLLGSLEQLIPLQSFK